MLKDFAREFATMIADAIWEFHTPLKKKSIREYLKCDAVFYSNHNPNVVLIVRYGQDFYCNNPYKNELREAIENYCECCETYDGELDEWGCNEYQRVMNKVRDRLIERFNTEVAK